MKKFLIPIALLILGLAVILIGIFLVRTKSAEPTVTVEEEVEETFVLADKDIVVSVSVSRITANTIVLEISGLKKKYRSVAYEISYETQGVVQGVTSRPLEVEDKETFTRDDIYLGTCSRNVCRPHAGVKKVSVVLEFTDISGQKSQFTKDFDL